MIALKLDVWMLPTVYIPDSPMAIRAISIYRILFKVWRARRFEWFKNKVVPSRSESLIDIGGDPGQWTQHEPLVKSIDVVDIREHHFDANLFPDHNVSVFVEDARELPYPDDKYDIAYSNSVLEHVGNLEEQKKFASEIRRVARKVWCQTPARECPIEPHYMAPFIHWLPRAWQRRLIRHLTPWGWLSKPPPEDVDFMVDTTRLVTRKEMEELFPDCDILVERLLWILPKSYIAYRNQASGNKLRE